MSRYGVYMFLFLCISCKEPNLRVLSWDGSSAALTYSFDDSSPSQIQHYDDLQATGARMTFYVTTSANWQENYNTSWSKAVKDGHEIGNHTQNHKYANASAINCDTEIDGCTDYIVNNFGQPDVWTIAYPYGDINWKNYSKEKFLLGRGFLKNGSIMPLDNDVDLFNLPTIAVIEDSGAIPGDHPDKYIRNLTEITNAIDSLRCDGAWGILVFHTILPTDQNWSYTCAIDDITSSIKYAQQQNDIWIDTVVNVGAYFIAQKMFAQLTPSGILDKTWSWSLPPHYPRGRWLTATIESGKLSQRGTELRSDARGYFKIALDEGSLTWSP